jgi:RNA polymerase sigma-70 factor, ECF subfamily
VLSDEEQRALVEQALGADPSARRSAAERLLDDFRAPALAAIGKTLAACGVGREHAEEALQAAALKFLAAGLRRYRGGAAVRTYFVRIAINAALDLARAARRARSGLEVDAIDASLAPSASAAEGRLQLEAERRALLECLEALSELLRRAIELYYLDEAGDCEVCAARLGVARNAFEQRLSRGRAALAECVRGKLGSP